MKMFIFMIFVLLLSKPSFAVTEFVVTVNKTGEDYASVATAEAALDNAGDIRDTGSVKCGSWDNQVGSNIADATAVTWDSGSSSGTLHHMTGTQYLLTVSVGSLANDDTVDDGGGNTFDVNGTPDSCQITIDVYDDNGTISGAFTVSGFTTDSDNYVKITSPVGERHDGTEFSGAKYSATSGTFRSSDQYTVIEFLIITTTETSGTNYEGLVDYTSGSDNSMYRNLIVIDANNSGAGTFASGIGAGTQTVTGLKVYNNIIYGSENDGISCGFGTSVSVHNNTVYNNAALGIDVAHTNCNIGARNNAGFDNGSADFDSGNFDASATNASSDATGTSGLQNLTTANQFVSITGGSEDFHLKSGADLIDVGTDLATGGDEIDIDGRDRDAEGDTWDIGADEFVAAAGGGGTGRTQVIFISKSGEIKSGQCWPENWYAPQEAGKCKSGRKWYLPGEFTRIN